METHGSHSHSHFDFEVGEVAICWMIQISPIRTLDFALCLELDKILKEPLNRDRESLITEAPCRACNVGGRTM